MKTGKYTTDCTWRNPESVQCCSCHRWGEPEKMYTITTPEQFTFYVCPDCQITISTPVDGFESMTIETPGIWNDGGTL